MTIIGAFLFNLGILVVLASRNEWIITIWPQGIAGEFGILLGVVIVWGTWFNHINQLIWNNRILILRTIELSISQALVFLVVALPILTIIFEQRLTLGVFLILVILGFMGISILYADLYFFGVPERLRDFGQRYLPVVQVIVLISAAFLIGIGLFYPDSYFQVLSNQLMMNLLIGSFRGYYVGIGLLLIYRMWFRIINNFYTQSVRFLSQYYREITTAGAIIPLLLGVIGFPIIKRNSFDSYLIPTVALIAGYLIGVGVWYFPKHQYSRGVNTVWSSVLIFWSLVLVLFSLGRLPEITSYPSNLGVLIPGTFFVFYLGVDSYLWRKELYHVLHQIWFFIRTSYRELVTAIGIGFMVAGSVFFKFFEFWEVNSPFHLIPAVSFLFGYALIMIIWRFPKHPVYFRGITTTLSASVFLWGVVIWNWSSKVWPPIVTIVYLGTASVISAFLWQKEVFLLFRRSAETIKRFIETYYRELISVFGLSSMFIGSLWWNDIFEVAAPLFYVGYLLTVGIWHFPTRHRSFRGITTTLSVVVFFSGLFQGNWNIDFSRSELVWPSIILLLYTGTASVFLAFLWQKEVFRLFRRTAKTIKQFIETYYRELVTVAGLALMILGLANWKGITTGSSLLFFCGYLLTVAIWHLPTRHRHFRGIATILSIVIFLWGLIPGNWRIDFSSSESVWPSAISILYMGTASVIPIYLWRMELYNLLHRTAKKIKQFIETYYRKLVTTAGLGLMILGLATWKGITTGSSLLFFCGYLLTVTIWHLPTRHRHFRGIATTMSILVFFWGIFQLSLIVEPTSNFLEIPFLITYSFIGIGSALPSFLWRVELWHLMKQVAKTIRQAVTRTLHMAYDLMKTVWNVITHAFWAIIRSGHRVLLSLYNNSVRLIQYVKLNFWTLVRYLFSLIGVLMISIGIFLLTVEGSQGLDGLLWMFAGFLSICLAWWENSIQILRAIGNSLWAFLISIRDFIIHMRRFLWAKIVGFIVFVRIYLEPIIRISTTLLGGLFVFLGIAGFSFELIAINIPSELLMVIGLFILVLTWLSQIYNYIKNTAHSVRKLFVGSLHFLWETGVGVKNAIIKAYLAVKVFFQTYHGLLLRYTVFFLGLFFMALAFQPWVSEILEFLPFILFMVGYSSSFFAWYRHANFRRNGTILSIIITLVGLYQVGYTTDPISWIVVVVGIAANGILWWTELKSYIRHRWNAFIGFMIRTVNEVKQAIKDFLRYVRSLFWNITGSVGIILDLCGIYLLFFPSMRMWGFFLFVGGSLLVIGAWNQEILNFLKQCSEVLSKAVTVILKFASRIWQQLKHFTRSIFDSTFILLFVTFGVLAFCYGLILVISGIFFDGSGDWTVGIRNFPIVGEIIWLIASFAQGRPFDLDGVPNLLGAWEVFPSIVLILLGGAIIFFGILITFISYIKREDIKVNKVKRRFSSSTSTGHKIDYEDKEGKKL